MRRKQRKSRKCAFRVIGAQARAPAFESILLDGHHEVPCSRMRSMGALDGRHSARVQSMISQAARRNSIERAFDVIVVGGGGTVDGGTGAALRAFRPVAPAALTRAPPLDLPMTATRNTTGLSRGWRGCGGRREGHHQRVIRRAFAFEDVYTTVGAPGVRLSVSQGGHAHSRVAPGLGSQGRVALRGARAGAEIASAEMACEARIRGTMVANPVATTLCSRAKPLNSPANEF
jgi:hypothetical protein